MEHTDDDVLTRLRSLRFPGGTYTIAHWEAYLLADCTGRGPLEGGIVHPIVCFHAPILGAGTSIAELFVAGEAGPAGSVGLEGYDWRVDRPLLEGVEYAVTGGVRSAERHVTGSGRAFDRVVFGIDLAEPDGTIAARVANIWRFRRDDAPAPPASPAGAPEATGGDGSSGDVTAAADAPLPAGPAPWSIEVSAERMKTMAAILRDPYEVHWDAEAVRAAGLGDRVINQGPLNLGYIANMCMEWMGDASVRRLAVSFPGRVHAGDSVTAHGEVTDVIEVGGERRAVLDVRLAVDGPGDPYDAVIGTTEVALAP